MLASWHLAASESLIGREALTDRSRSCRSARTPRRCRTPRPRRALRGISSGSSRPPPGRTEQPCSSHPRSRFPGWPARRRQPRRPMRTQRELRYPSGKQKLVDLSHALCPLSNVLESMAIVRAALRGMGSIRVNVWLRSGEHGRLTDVDPARLEGGSRLVQLLLGHGDEFRPLRDRGFVVEHVGEERLDRRLLGQRVLVRVAEELPRQRRVLGLDGLDGRGDAALAAVDLDALDLLRVREQVRETEVAERAPLGRRRRRRSRCRPRLRSSRSGSRPPHRRSRR